MTTRSTRSIGITAILFIAGCNSPVQPRLAVDVVVKFDRTSYRFSTQNYRDTALVTVLNQTDTAILSWSPTQIWFQSDTGWTFMYWHDQGFPRIDPHGSMTARFYFSDYGFPDGVYRVGVEYEADTAVVKAPAFRLSFSPGVTVTH
jgi:hypothetical protein